MNEASYPKAYLYQRIVKAKLFIDAHYHEAIDLDNISDEAYFSKFHFIRTFKKIYGKTPHQHLISVRVAKAIDLLKEGRPVSEVCMEVGFESNTSFSGLYKKYTGYTPAAYQQQELQRKQLTIESPQNFVPGCFGNAFGYFEKSNFQEVQL